MVIATGPDAVCRSCSAGPGYLPLRWQDTNARVVQRLAFGDLSRLGYPWSALGAFTRAAADGVTVAVDDGFVRALKAGQVTVKPATGGGKMNPSTWHRWRWHGVWQCRVRLGGVLVQATG